MYIYVPLKYVCTFSTLMLLDRGRGVQRHGITSNDSGLQESCGGSSATQSIKG